MTERPTREECIRLLDTLMSMPGAENYADVLQATIHYLTEDATPTLFPVEGEEA